MLLLHTDSLSNYGLHRIFHFAKEAGFDGVELAINPKKLDTQNPEYLDLLSKETGVKIIAVQAAPKTNKKRMEVAFKVAESVGANLITIQPTGYMDFGASGWIKENVPKLRARGHMKICLMNVPDERVLGLLPKYGMTGMNDLRDFHEVTLDVSNLVSRNIGPLDFYEKMKKAIMHVHLSNYRGEKDHTILNDGRLPIESLLKKMKRDGYLGHFSIKVRPSELHSGHDDMAVIKRLKDCKDFFAEYFV